MLRRSIDALRQGAAGPSRARRLLGPALVLALLLLGAWTAWPGVAQDQTAASPGAPAAISGLAVDPTDGSLLRAGGGLFRSADDSQHWTALSLPAALHPDQMRWVATTAKAPKSLYAAGPGAGIVRSDDRGQTWRSVSGRLPSQAIGAFAVHSFRPDTLYAWIEGQGVFRTEDDGGAWELMDQGPPAPVVALAHSTLEGSMNTGWLYAATPDGPYLSMDCF
jgi:photosystem II stability/assembly factor-like uncharacterized protein